MNTTKKQKEQKPIMKQQPGMAVTTDIKVGGGNTHADTPTGGWGSNGGRRHWS